jgi:hypothetical protein
VQGRHPKLGWTLRELRAQVLPAFHTVVVGQDHVRGLEGVDGKVAVDDHIRIVGAAVENGATANALDGMGMRRLIWVNDWGTACTSRRISLDEPLGTPEQA